MIWLCSYFAIQSSCVCKMRYFYEQTSGVFRKFLHLKREHLFARGDYDKNSKEQLKEVKRF